jgi:uncharacterized protein (DUF1330 family)
VPDLIHKHGGRYIVPSVEPTVVESPRADSQRCVVLEFRGRQAAETLLDERSKADLHEIWAQTTDSRILLIDGCS